MNGVRYSMCPACGGDGWEFCELCAGEGIVTATAAQAWRDAIDAWAATLFQEEPLQLLQEKKPVSPRARR